MLRPTKSLKTRCLQLCYVGTALETFKSRIVGQPCNLQELHALKLHVSFHFISLHRFHSVYISFALPISFTICLCSIPFSTFCAAVSLVSSQYLDYCGVMQQYAATWVLPALTCWTRPLIGLLVVLITILTTSVHSTVQKQSYLRAGVQ